eukprot:COSAG02_NODE_212_length_28729_cov_45.980196_3_plen_557_part_00
MISVVIREKSQRLEAVRGSPEFISWFSLIQTIPTQPVREHVAAGFLSTAAGMWQLRLAVVLCAGAAPVAASGLVAERVEPAAGRCLSQSSASLTVSWPRVGTADLYDVEYATVVAGDYAFDRFWSQTTYCDTDGLPTQQCRAMLEDLLPATAYVLRMRAHSAAISSLAIGWSNFSASWSCSTKPLLAHAPGIPVRNGSLSLSAISLRWSAASTVQARRLTGYTVEHHDDDQNWIVLKTVDAPAVGTTLYGLNPATAYTLRIVAHSTAIASTGVVLSTAGEPSTLRTANPKQRMLTVWRVTDFLANERTIDYLGDHDGGSADGVSLFMAGNQNNAGWEPFDIREATLALYCVAVDASHGFAPYASCNTRAAGEPPSCACENFADRQIGHQGNISIARDCGAPGQGDTLTDGSRKPSTCSCSNESLAQSRAYVGSQPVFWPWPGAWQWGPTGADGYPQNIPSGTWYSFPADAECRDPASKDWLEPLWNGSSCSWAAAHLTKVVRGSQLIRAGWNTSNSTSVPDYHSWSPAHEQVLGNAKIMTAAADSLLGAANRCCGC